MATQAGGLGHRRWQRTEGGWRTRVGSDSALVARGAVIGAAELAVAAERAQQRRSVHPGPLRAPAEPDRSAAREVTHSAMGCVITARVIAVARWRAGQRHIRTQRSGQALGAIVMVGCHAGPAVWGGARRAVQGRQRALTCRAGRWARAARGARINDVVARDRVVGQRLATRADHSSLRRRRRIECDQRIGVVADGASVARGYLVCAAELAVAAERAQHRLARHPAGQRAPAEPDRWVAMRL